MSFDICIDARKGGHHSGNWGGLLSDPAIQLAHAISSVTSPNGEILVPEWRPEGVPENVRRSLADCEREDGGDARIDLGWGEPGLSPAERVFACAKKVPVVNET